MLTEDKQETKDSLPLGAVAVSRLSALLWVPEPWFPDDNTEGPGARWHLHTQWITLEGETLSLWNLSLLSGKVTNNTCAFCSGGRCYLYLSRMFTIQMSLKIQSRTAIVSALLIRWAEAWETFWRTVIRSVLRSKSGQGIMSTILNCYCR